MFQIPNKRVCLVVLLLTGCQEKGAITVDADDSITKPEQTDSATSTTVPDSPIDNDNDGWPESSDCDDQNPEIHPEAEEQCNQQDDNCNGEIDEGLEVNWYLDEDGDGYGGSLLGTSCDTIAGGVLNGDDCDDTNPEIYPLNSAQVDGIDSDCDGRKDWRLSIYVAVDDAGEICIGSWHKRHDGCICYYQIVKTMGPSMLVDH